MRKFNFRPYVFAALVSVGFILSTGCVSRSDYNKKMYELKNALLEERVNNLEDKVLKLQGELSEQDRFFFQWCESLGIYAEKVGAVGAQSDLARQADIRTIVERLHQLIYPSAFPQKTPELLRTSLEQ